MRDAHIFLFDMPKKYRTLGEFLEATGTTQVDFADRVGILQSTVSRIVNGARTPSLELAIRIAEEANIPLESLVPRKGRAA